MRILNLAVDYTDVKSAAEQILSGILCVMKRLDMYAENQKKHLWQDEGPVAPIQNAKVLVVGNDVISSAVKEQLLTLGGVEYTGEKADIVVNCGGTPIEQFPELGVRAVYAGLNVDELPEELFAAVIINRKGVSANV